MVTNSKKSIPLGLRASEEEMEAFDWLSKETSRSRSGAVKWAALKVAKELGFVSKKKAVSPGRK